MRMAGILRSARKISFMTRWRCREVGKTGENLKRDNNILCI
jgi:hypothetical protein